MSILNIIKELKSNNSSLYKIEILEKYKEDILFKKVLYYTYNKEYVYYIKKIPDYKNSQTSLSFEDVFSFLDELRYREISGDNAIEKLRNVFSCLHPDDQKVLELILQRDLKCGINIKSINKVFKNFIPVTPYMGAIGYDEKKVSKLFKENEIVYSEIKYDGRYCNIIIKEDGINFVSRNGKPTPIFGLLFNDLISLQKSHNNIVLNGELLVKGYDRLQANGIISSIITINEKELYGEEVFKDKEKLFKKFGLAFDVLQDLIYFVCWDCIPYNDYIKEFYQINRKNRLKQLDKLKELFNSQDLTGIEIIEYKILKDKNEALIELKDKLNKGLEGIILKGSEQVWENKKPNGQIKFKIEIELDLKIIGFKEGTKGSKYENDLGSIHCETSDKKLNVFVGGIDEELRTEIWNNKEKYIDKIICVKCNGLSINKSGEYNLYFPAFMEIRNDKNTPNALQECIDIEQASLKLKG